MNNYNSFEIKSNAIYREIVSVSFTPVTEVNITRKYKKGDWRFWNGGVAQLDRATAF